MRLILKTDKRRYFRQVLELLSPVPPFSTITSKERSVLGEFMYLNWSYRELSSEDKKKILFSTQNKEAIRFTLNMSKEALNVTLYVLRKKGFITYDRIISEFEFLPERVLEYVFIEEEVTDDSGS